MAHSYVSIVIHYVFSTKNRRRWIPLEIEGRLRPYIGGIARKNRFKTLAVGGDDDHQHVVASLPSTMAIAKAAQLIKGGSSLWLSDAFAELKGFEWQEGYGGFSVSISHVDETIAYVRNQRQHHEKQTFEEEYTGFLKKHGIEFDPQYVWG
ncbi:MAG: IS200/IS605 family transposase [Phycisphaerae bacterium]|nr:IS200/IS605 family transposase [Phycisphaerae bacterium]